MKLKDFREMINRMLFCADEHFARIKPDWEDVYLEVSGGKLIMATFTVLPFYRMGLASVDLKPDNRSDDCSAYVRAAFLRELAGNENLKSLRLGFPPSQDEWSFAEKHRHGDNEPLWFSDAGGGHVYLNIGESALLIRRPAFYSGRGYEFTRYCHDRENYLDDIFPVSFSVDRRMLLEALNTVSVIVTKQFSCMLYADLSPGKMLMRAFDFGDSAETEIPCDYSGMETGLTFEVKLFRETIEHIETERVNIRFCMGYVDTAILPMHSSQHRQDYFFVLSQRTKWGTDNEQ